RVARAFACTTPAQSNPVSTRAAAPDSARRHLAQEPQAALSQSNAARPAAPGVGAVPAIRVPHSQSPGTPSAVQPGGAGLCVANTGAKPGQVSAAAGGF